MRRASHWLVAGMKIAVIGKGNIGGTLGSRWQAAGHDVVYGARDGSGEGPGGAPVRGMADACLTAIGVETTAAAVAAHYGPSLLDGWLVDERDKATADDPSLSGIAVRALPLYMRDVPSSAAIAQAAIELAVELTP